MVEDDILFTNHEPAGVILTLFQFLVIRSPCTSRWSFETKHYDLAFGIYRKVTNNPKKLSDMKQVIPTTRVNSHFVPEDGYLTCEEPGTCKSSVSTLQFKSVIITHKRIIF